MNAEKANIQTGVDAVSYTHLQLAAAAKTFKIFVKTKKLMLFCQINLNKSTTFSRPFGSNLGQVA